MRKSIILAIVLMVAFAAVPAFASVQNVKIGGSVDSTFLHRDNFDFGVNVASDSNQNVFLTQTTLQVDADLTDQVSVTVALINERAWGNVGTSTTYDNDDVSRTVTVDSNDNTDISINLAYITLREMLYSPLTVVVGRQAFSYGNSLIIDSAGTNNTAPTDSGLAGVAVDLTKQTAQDAIRLILDYNPLTLEVLIAKVDSNALTLADNKDDVDLYGINATYELGDDMNTQVEAYFFARIDKSGNVGSVGSKSDTVYIPGLRASADVLEGLNIQAELAWQRGNNVSSSATGIDNEQRSAMAAQIISSYQIPDSVLPDVLQESDPVLQYVFTYVSGDSNPNDRGYANQTSTNKDTAWDPMFENQGGGTIYSTLFNLSNLRIHAVSLQASVIEDVTAKITWSGLWLDKKIDSGNGTLALVQPDGTAAVGMGVKTSNKGLGYEIDLDTTYDYTEDVQLGISTGWFVPGDVFTSANDDIASQLLIHGNVNF